MSYQFSTHFHLKNEINYQSLDKLHEQFKLYKSEIYSYLSIKHGGLHSLNNKIVIKLEDIICIS